MGVEFDNLRSTQFEWLRAQGFDVVEYYRVTSEQVAKCVAEFEEKNSALRCAVGWTGRDVQ